MKKKNFFCLTWCPEGWDGWREQQVTNTVTVHTSTTPAVTQTDNI